MVQRGVAMSEDKAKQDELSDEQLFRYARHLVLNQISEQGQLKLLNAKVAVIGAGGLGAPTLLYLAASGLGSITIIDHDEVELSNLQRQIIHTNSSIGNKKALSAQKTLSAINPEVTILPIATALDHSNALALLKGHDLIIDGSDSWQTRLSAAQAAQALKIPLLYGAIYQFDGQMTLLRPYKDTPSLNDIFPHGPKVVVGAVKMSVFSRQLAALWDL